VPGKIWFFCLSFIAGLKIPKNEKMAEYKKKYFARSLASLCSNSPDIYRDEDGIQCLPFIGSGGAVRITQGLFHLSYYIAKIRHVRAS
jgi:hypothetical protein